MPRPKSRKCKERNDRNHWLNDFEDTRRRFENVGKEKWEEKDKSKKTSDSQI